MKIQKGSTRIACVGEYTTIKVPCPALVSDQAKSLALYFRHVRFPQFLHNLIGPENSESSILFGIQGMCASAREAESWKSLQGIVVPTRSFLMGVIAVQPTTEDLPIHGKDIFAEDDFTYRVMKKAIDEKEIKRAGARHTLSNVKNFGLLDGRILLRDFGAPGIPELLMQHKESVLRELQILAIELG